MKGLSGNCKLVYKICLPKSPTCNDGKIKFYFEVL